MFTRGVHTAPPCSDETYKVLERIGRMLDRDVCWCFQRRFHFQLEGGGWTLAVSPESAGRIRLEACRWTRPEATLWILVDDDARLAAAVRELQEMGGARVSV